MPEVETLRRGLAKATTGQRITAIHITDERVLKRVESIAFVERLNGVAVKAVNRRGKFLLFEVGHGALPSFHLVVHLNMKGSIRMFKSDVPVQKYECVRVGLSSGAVLVYADMWTWGDWHLDDASDYRLVSDVASMGPEPLEEGWSGAVLASRLAGKRGLIKSVLLDQKVVAGVGNIYADESLFAAGVSPKRQASGLDVAECDALAASIAETLGSAVCYGGSLGEYVDLDGNPGTYEPKVYGGKGKPCPRCGGPLMKVSIGGRGTTYCPDCQR
ncbi:MAG: bifunctional DNA-formamidopyrimidine glycosylase/DNA-(apurinic or apyrimidinic site) lyase [Armatimonadota bacterium]